MLFLFQNIISRPFNFLTLVPHKPAFCKKQFLVIIILKKKNRLLNMYISISIFLTNNFLFSAIKMTALCVGYGHLIQGRAISILIQHIWLSYRITAFSKQKQNWIHLLAINHEIGIFISSEWHLMTFWILYVLYVFMFLYD